MYAEEMACLLGVGAKEGRGWMEIIGNQVDRTRLEDRKLRVQPLNLQLCSLTQIFQESSQSLPHFKAKLFLLKAAAVFLK